MIELRLLGTVELVAHGRPMRLSREQVRCLLAALAVDVNRPLALNTLADRIWDGQLPAEPVNSLYSLVSRLRRDLDAAARAEGLGKGTIGIANHAHAYTLEAAPEIIDYHRFRQLAEQARRDAARGDDESALALLRQADALWHGEPLAGLHGDWATATRAVLRSAQLAAATVRVAAGLRLGQFAELVTDLTPLADRYDTNQPLVAGLMTALYGAGRQDEAFALYLRTRRALKNRLGIEPSKDLAELHEGILAGLPAAELVPRPTARAAIRPAPAPTPAPAPAVPHNLPTPRLLVGREDELAAATRAGSDGPRVISGLGGTGKTSLAVHVAHRLREQYPDGQIRVVLHAHSATQRPLPPDAVLTALLRALDLPPQSVPADREKRTALWHRLITERRFVVILDDVAGADQVRDLLPLASRSLVLLTSRRGLSELPGAQHILLDALPPDQAVALFRTLVGPDRADDEERIEEIVRRCLCHPYAVELVATRFKSRSSWTLEHLLQRLRRTAQLLDEIHDTRRDLAPILELSYLALSEEHQESFRLLSLHPGPRFGQHAAAALLGRSPAATERAVEELIETHLLQEPLPEAYTFHDLMAEFAAGLAHRTAPGPAERAAMSRLVRFTIDAVDRADRLLYPHRLRLTLPTRLTLAEPTLHWDDPAAARRWMSSELDGLLAVLRYLEEHEQDPETAWFTHALGGFLDAEGYWGEALPLHQAAADHWHATGDLHAETRALLDLAGLHIHLAQLPQAATINAQATTLARLADDQEGIAEAISQSGVLHGTTGDFRAALKSQQQALAMALECGNSLQADRIRNNIGIITIYLDDLPTAIANLEDALVGFRRMGNLRMEASALGNLGQLLLQKGEVNSGRLLMERCLAIGERILPAHEQARARTNLIPALAPDDWERAHQLGISALAVFRRTGERLAQLGTMTALGDLLRRAGHPEQAIQWYQDALPLSTVLGADHERIAATRGLGEAEAAAGLLDAAHNHLVAALELAQRLDNPHEEGETLRALGETLALLGDRTGASDLRRLGVRIPNQPAAPVRPAPEAASPQASTTPTASNTSSS
ncbi:AfsR/SARP family transcriptional regulator [Kitasatospora viridis]|uniref:DNA-binding SARP family transcriptional activator n=1 Tax=Kitasatospora viridis TaxID=281105 RepID=A0A561UN89_9ACTN|nr:AfsR/SARP family transcriptional regulator [Kitasatospora viridis]TWG00817.1 DNA-binding SARP family transcriptional activator [Kitasatospora viridis]